jgi:hypothetical protein
MKDLNDLLAKTISERMEVKANLKMVSYLLKKDPFNDSVKNHVDYLLDKLKELDEVEKTIKKFLQ